MSPRAIRDLLCRRSKDFVKPRVAEKIFSTVGARGLVASNGNKHRVAFIYIDKPGGLLFADTKLLQLHRQQISAAYTPCNVREQCPIIVEQALRMAESMDAENKEQGCVYLWDILNRAGLAIVCKTQLDTHFDPIRHETTVKKVLERFLFGISLGTCVKALMCCALPESIQTIVQPQVPGLADLKCFVRRIITEEKKQTQTRRRMSGKRATLLSCLLEGDIFGDGERVQQSVDFLLAGSATVTFTMQWALFVLSRDPDLQGKVRNEVRQCLPSPTTTRLDEWSHIFLKRLDDGLPSLQAFCNEVFRCYPAISLTGREACCDTTLAGVYVPKGTLVLLSPPVANQNPEWWGPDAAEFNPARWLNGDGSFNSSAGGNQIHNRYTFLTFGQGPRSCIGQELGRLEVNIMVAIMLGKFEMQLADEQKEPVVMGILSPIPRDDVVVHLRELHGW
ncbi:unnamed protein product [Aspergillus oryzae]|nr:unnamed protein product [Aspergillus oryzae]